jgi:hypothetical protein
VKSLQNLKKHSHVTNVQQKYFNTILKDVQEDEIVLQIDFAENYVCDTQNAIQQAHFTKRQIAVYTAHATSKNFSQSYVIVSDSIEHSKYAVYAFNKAIIEDLKVISPNVTKLIFISDGCAQQFKNQFTLSLLCHSEEDFGIKTQHNFLSTSHGKGAVDGIGGTIKRNVRTKVMSTPGLEVNNAQEFANVARSFCKDTKVFHIPHDEIERTKIVLDKKWKNLKSFNGIRSCHSFKPISNFEIEACITSEGDGEKIWTVFKDKK